MLDNSHRLSEEVKKHLKPEEIDMLDGWEIHSGGGQVAKFQAAAQIYSARVLANASEELKKSNEKIAESNDRYASAMTILTACLVFVGLIQMFVQGIEIFGNSIFVYLVFVAGIVLLFTFPFRALLIEILKKK